MTDRARVTGIGGVFFKARDPVALAAWYREHLGIEMQEGGTFGMFPASSAGAQPDMVWSVFPADTKYFGEGSAGWMVNYRVADLDAMLQQLRDAGAWVSEKIDESDFGRFGWAADPEGTRFELWQPAA